MNFLAIALGGALGALARYGVVAYLFPVLPNRFPIGTMAANIVGCFLIGVFYIVIMEKQLLGPQWRLFAITGLLGAFTTFSSFSLEAVQLWQYGNIALALIYIFATLIACLIATVIALYLTPMLIK